MKRLLLLIALISVCAISRAQNYYPVKSVTLAKYNHYSSTWDLDQPEASTLEITIKNNIMMIDNVAQSSFILGSMIQKDEDGEQYSWKATDQEGRHCNISLFYSARDQSKVICIMYSDSAFYYALY